MHVHIVHEFGDEAFGALRAALDTAVTFSSGPEIPDRDVHVLVNGRPSVEQADACRGLRLLVVPWAGIPPQAAEVARERPGLALHNLHHNAAATAETAVALLLAAAKHLVPMDRALRAHDWRPRYDANPSVRLAGKTALVLGLGAIGARVARTCLGLGMDVLATRRDPSAGAVPDVEVHAPQQLPELLPRAHVVVVCVPLTDATRGLLGAPELALLPRGAVLVNIARGPVVDERALYDALASGRLHSAGLDVWYAYPSDEQSRASTAPSGLPFHELDNVVLSPHRAGGAIGNEPLRMTHLAELLNAAAGGAAPPGRVDVSRGY